ncbi:YdiU family protein [Streptococcus suis]|nr:YdiU family protein [Streptococcus suis]
MTTITLKVSEADKNFMKAMAKFEGISPFGAYSYQDIGGFGR